MDTKVITQYMNHLPTCNKMQNWDEAYDAFANTPEKFRDFAYDLALQELDDKRNKCTCGLSSVLFHLEHQPFAASPTEIGQQGDWQADKKNIYIPPSGEQLRIYRDVEWKQYIRADVFASQPTPPQEEQDELTKCQMSFKDKECWHEKCPAKTHGKCTLPWHGDNIQMD